MKHCRLRGEEEFELFMHWWELYEKNSYNRNFFFLILLFCDFSLESSSVFPNCLLLQQQASHQ